jgi:hypothetical protein
MRERERSIRQADTDVTETTGTSCCARRLLLLLLLVFFLVYVLHRLAARHVEGHRHPAPRPPQRLVSALALPLVHVALLLRRQPRAGLVVVALRREEKREGVVFINQSRARENGVVRTMITESQTETDRVNRQDIQADIQRYIDSQTYTKQTYSFMHEAAEAAV